MKGFAKSVLGVALLEVLLVLAIAAMLIVLSVRYYQSVVANKQVEAIMAQFKAIISAADGIAQSSGSYSTVTQSALDRLLPENTLITPWGTSIFVSNQGGSVLYINSDGNVPSEVCPILYEKLAANNHFSTQPSPTPFNASQCSGTVNNLTVYYIANP